MKRNIYALHILLTFCLKLKSIHVVNKELYLKFLRYKTCSLYHENCLKIYYCFQYHKKSVSAKIAFLPPKSSFFTTHLSISSDLFLFLWPPMFFSPVFSKIPASKIVPNLEKLQKNKSYCFIFVFAQYLQIASILWIQITTWLDDFYFVSDSSEVINLFFF